MAVVQNMDVQSSEGEVMLLSKDADRVYQEAELKSMILQQKRAICKDMEDQLLNRRLLKQITRTLNQLLIEHNEGVLRSMPL